MSTTVPPRDGDASMPTAPRSPLADEEALRSVFLAEYTALAAEARAELGSEAAVLAPKVVEGAFVRAWDARARLETPAQLHQFLIDDVHHAAARALSRRAAAHRMAGHDTNGSAHANHAAAEPSIEESWAHIQHALHGEEHSPKALAEAAAISRHEAAEHIAGAAKEKSIWAALGVGALVMAAVVGLLFWMDRLGADTKAATAVNAPGAREVATVPAQIGVVTLDDGTRVRIAPESKLSIPQTFGPNLRAVRLDGAATFDVSPGQSRDFQVHSRGAIVEAQGTSFTVRSYADDDALTLVVGEGTVQVRQAGEKHDVAAGSSLFIRPGEGARAATAEERDAADAWRSGTLVVANRPLREVLPQFRRWYGLNIMVQQPPLLERPVTMRVSLDSSRAAIRAVEASTGLQFGYIGPNMVFREPAAKGAAAKPGAKRR